MNKTNIEKCNGNGGVYKMDKSSITNCMNCLYQPMCKESEKFIRDHEYSKVIGKLIDPETYVMSICDKFEDKTKYIKLPCKIGDTVWDKNAEPFVIYEIKIFSKVINIKGKSPVTGENKSFSLGKWSIGKTVFLTHEEAEKTLEEVKENDKQ